jgi:hypothetical protein
VCPPAEARPLRLFVDVGGSMAASISGLVLQNPCQSGFAHSARHRRSKLQVQKSFH